MNRLFGIAAFGLGLGVLAWVGWGFVGASPLALLMTVAIAAAYLLGAWEIQRLRAANLGLAAALDGLATAPAALADWLPAVPATLRPAVRQRIEDARAPLPGPALTPYLVGLLVMLGMLGTFLGMVLTFKGAAFALEGSADLQAMRAALAAPIQGLGLAFGTSIAGVAASAMLGLMSALARRERAELVRRLDGHIAAELRPFSLSHQRQESLRAMQQQTQAWPQLADRLAGLMDGLEARSHALDERLGQQQARFHEQAASSYQQLAESVAASLNGSLAASARAAAEGVQPVVRAALDTLAREAGEMHERVAASAQAQVVALGERFEHGSAALLEAQRQAIGQARAEQARLDAERLEAWSAQLAELSQALHGQWQRQGEQAQARQQALDEALARSARALTEHTATQASEQLGRVAQVLGQAEALVAARVDSEARWNDQQAERLARQQAALAEQASQATQALREASERVTERAGEQATRTLERMEAVLQRSEELVAGRGASEARWTEEQGRRMDQLATLWRGELVALREQQAEHGQAAVERLGGLQAALASQLATLGQALEAPMERMMRTAADVPQAAAEVMLRLREATARLDEREQRALQERAELVARVDTLVAGLREAADGQRAAIEGLVASADAVLAQAGQGFAQALVAQGEQAAALSARVGAGAVEMGALGEAFQQGLSQFGAGNERLTETLARVEAAIQQSLARSDEQLAYYVAQAREVIDLSISAQQGIVEDLRRLRGPRPAPAPTQAEGTQA